MEIKSEIAALKVEMSILKKMVTLLAGRISEQLEKIIQVSPPEQSADSLICYSCRGVDHYKCECQSLSISEDNLQRSLKNSRELARCLTTSASF